MHPPPPNLQMANQKLPKLIFYQSSGIYVYMYMQNRNTHFHKIKYKLDLKVPQ